MPDDNDLPFGLYERLVTAGLKRAAPIDRNSNKNDHRKTPSTAQRLVRQLQQ
jgi:hypothetical protein